LLSNFRDRRWLLLAGLVVPILILIVALTAGDGSLPTQPLGAARDTGGPVVTGTGPAARPTTAHRPAAPPAKVTARQAAELRREQRETAVLRARQLSAQARARHDAAVRRARHAAALRRARYAALVRQARHAATVRRAHFSAATHRARHAAAACRRRHWPYTCRVRHAAAIRRARHTLHRAARHAAAVFHGRRAALLRPARHAAALQAARRKALRARALRARLRAAFRLPRRTHPAHIVRGHYLRSLAGRPRDRTSMHRLGAADAARNPGGMGHLVLLDIGGQVRHGVLLSATRRFVSYRGLTGALRAYVAGYHSRQRPNAPATIAIGTNNDLYTSAASGRAWARRVVNPVRATARGYHSITVAGADDIEPGFRAGPRRTRAWLGGFLHNTAAPFVYNGSADGCSPRRARSHCGHGWNTTQLAALAGGAAPARIVALPQIYNPTMAAQWAQIARTAKLSHRRPLRIIGPLTEQAACGHDPWCPSMPSRRAWLLLHRQLRRARLRPTSLPMQVDLDVR
jgi:hypothetical protein